LHPTLVEGLVSTIIPVHNRPALLREAVASVLAQSYRPIEVIIVDDGSTDGTGREAEALAEAHSEVRAIHRQNGGPGAARETGRLVARGGFIQYLDSDDLLLPRKFELQVGGLRHCSDCAVSYGKTRFYAHGERATDVAWKRTGERIPTMFPSFLQSRWWDTSTPLYRREAIDLAGPWTKLRNEEDWEYDCRIASKGYRLHYCDAFVSDTRTTLGYQLSAAGSSDPKKLRDRAAAHMLILQHAYASGISHNTFEMRHFARELFLLARQCGAAGLAEEARSLFECARQASQGNGNYGLDFFLYGAGARLLGWRAMGRLAGRVDRFRA
jgi:glycosyltransferase involved in cell wall biosynthesis